MLSSTAKTWYSEPSVGTISAAASDRRSSVKTGSGQTFSRRVEWRLAASGLFSTLAFHFTVSWQPLIEGAASATSGLHSRFFQETSLHIFENFVGPDGFNNFQGLASWNGEWRTPPSSRFTSIWETFCTMAAEILGVELDDTTIWWSTSKDYSNTHAFPYHILQKIDYKRINLNIDYHKLQVIKTTATFQYWSILIERRSRKCTDNHGWTNYCGSQNNTIRDENERNIGHFLREKFRTKGHLKSCSPRL